MADNLNHKNQRVALVIGCIVVGMVGLAYASVPLYQLFCQVTGFGGTTQVSEAAPGAKVASSLRAMRFNAHVPPGLEWRVSPPQGEIDITPGQEVKVVYRATNPSDSPVTGTSSFNVTPHKVGQYFMKIECFCFTEQTLQSGETVEMPVVFYLDPDIDTDTNTIEVPEITLSYSFFQVK